MAHGPVREVVRDARIGMTPTYQVIAEESRTVTKKLYNDLGTWITTHSVTLPAGRVVGNWPLEWLAERAAERKRKRFKQRYSVRVKRRKDQ